MAYGPDEFFEETAESLDELDNLTDHFPVTWINVEGLGDVDVIRQLGERFGLHILALEDVVHIHQRAKVEDYDDHLFIVVRMLYSGMWTDSVAAAIETEQLAMFVGPNYVLTFQDGHSGDCLDTLRNRIRNAHGRIRKVNAGGLAYSIIDTVIDHYFATVEDLASQLDAIDEKVVSEMIPGPSRLCPSSEPGCCSCGECSGLTTKRFIS